LPTFVQVRAITTRADPLEGGDAIVEGEQTALQKHHVSAIALARSNCHILYSALRSQISPLQRPFVQQVERKDEDYDPP
jgi:hypothetical protein